MGQLPKINTKIEDLSVGILVHQKMSRKQYHVAFWIWDPKSYQSPKHSFGDFEGFTQNSCGGICHCVWVMALSRIPKIHFSWILLFNQNQRICYVSYLAKIKALKVSGLFLFGFDKNRWWRFRKNFWPSQNIYTLSKVLPCSAVANAQWNHMISEGAFLVFETIAFWKMEYKSNLELFVLILILW